jgi:hypothetical protein
VSVLHCGHFTCNDCLDEIMRTGPKCPECREPIKRRGGQVMTVTIKKPKTEEDDDQDVELGNNEIVQKYGSKIFEFVKFTRVTLEKDPESKIILFIQFNRFVVGESNHLD